MLSFHVAWTTVIHFYAALQTTCFNVCSRCKMLQLGSLQAFGVVTTSLLSSNNFIGCRLRQRVNFKLAVLVYQALRNTTAQYLVEDCQLVSKHWSTPPAISRRRHLYRSANKNALCRQEFLGCWLAAVEQFTS